MHESELLVNISSLDVWLWFSEGTGKIWKEHLCFLHLCFCGYSLTESCQHFGYASLDWQPQWPVCEKKMEEKGCLLSVTGYCHQSERVICCEKVDVKTVERSLWFQKTTTVFVGVLDVVKSSALPAGLHTNMLDEGTMGSK